MLSIVETQQITIFRNPHLTTLIQMKSLAPSGPKCFASPTLVANTRASLDSEASSMPLIGGGVQRREGMGYNGGGGVFQINHFFIT